MADTKEVELAKRGVEAFVDRANELHHQGRHAEALKQLQVCFRIDIVMVLFSVHAEFVIKNLVHRTTARSKFSSF